MYHTFCIHSSVEGHLGSFQLLAIINKSAMNMVEHVGASFAYMPRSGIVRSSGSTMSNFLRKLQTNFQSGCKVVSIYIYIYIWIHSFFPFFNWKVFAFTF